MGEQLGVLRLGGEALASAEWPDLLGGLSGRGFPREVGSGPSGCPGGPRAELWDVKAGGRCQPSCGWQGNGAFLLWSRPQGWAGAAHAAPRTPPPGRGISSVGGHRSPQHLEPQKGLSLGVCGLWGAGQKGEAAFLLWLHVGLWE